MDMAAHARASTSPGRTREFRRVPVVGACVGGATAAVCAGQSIGDMVRLLSLAAGQAAYLADGLAGAAGDQLRQARGDVERPAGRAGLEALGFRGGQALVREAQGGALRGRGDGRGVRGRGRCPVVRRDRRVGRRPARRRRLPLWVRSRCPSESAIRRLMGRVDADRFDAVIGRFVQRLCAATAPVGRRRVLAVDGKTLRGSRRPPTGGARHSARGDRPAHSGRARPDQRRRQDQRDHRVHPAAGHPDQH